MIDHDECESFLTDEHKLCPRCSKDKLCCEIGWVDCWECDGEGVSGHDCGEDCCCCLYPEDNVTCNICDGDGGWWECLGRCDSEGVHVREEKPCSNP